MAATSSAAAASAANRAAEKLDNLKSISFVRPRSISATASRRAAHASGAQERGHVGDRVTLNVGGVKFVTRRAILRRVPNSRLADLAESEAFVENASTVHHDVFFDRSSALFDYVLNLYRTGELHFPHNLCARHVISELDYWRISDEQLSTCCKTRLKSDLLALEDVAEITALVGNDQTEIGEQSLWLDSDGKVGTFSELLSQILKSITMVFGTRQKQKWRIFIQSLSATKYDLLFILSLFLLSTFLFGTIIYVAESRERFPEVTSAFWWATVTMTTVGYGGGNLAPVTLVGRVTGGACALFGLLVTAVTFASIHVTYARNMHIYDVMTRKERRNAQHAQGYEVPENSRLIISALDQVTPSDVTSADDENRKSVTNDNVIASPITLKSTISSDVRRSLNDVRGENRASPLVGGQRGSIPIRSKVSGVRASSERNVSDLQSTNEVVIRDRKKVL